MLVFDPNIGDFTGCIPAFSNSKVLAGNLVRSPSDPLQLSPPDESTSGSGPGPGKPPGVQQDQSHYW